MWNNLINRNRIWWVIQLNGRKLALEKLFYLCRIQIWLNMISSTLLFSFIQKTASVLLRMASHPRACGRKLNQLSVFILRNFPFQTIDDYICVIIHFLSLSGVVQSITQRKSLRTIFLLAGRFQTCGIELFQFKSVRKPVSGRLHIWLRRSSKADTSDEMRHVTTCFMQNATWKQLL